MRELYMANGEGFALVYSIISNLSFTEIEKIRNGITKHKNSGQVPMVLVGNKKDLEAKREVPTEKAKAITKGIIIAFFICYSYRTREETVFLFYYYIYHFFRVLSLVLQMYIHLEQ